MNMKKTKYTTISIPVTLARKIEERIEETGFNSLSSYVTYVLRQIISSTEAPKKTTAFSEEDEEKIKKRLRGLGYIS
ncbi:MAG: CopG family transcriptional regulator [Candidatus Aenigmarchaeota archaeon]|nr:CopG family transcriptional regulator [Candidatus Aenigmarchaeota archaeon]